MEGGQNVSVLRCEGSVWRRVDSAVPEESPVRLHVNGQEVVTFLCTPQAVDLLALGFLRSEGIIQGFEDVRLVKACPSQTCVDVWLKRADFQMSSRRAITSACGGGVTFVELSGAAPRGIALSVTAGQMGRLMVAMERAASLHRQVGGVHTAALASGEALLAVAEDVGRHDALDKLWGRCMVERIPTRDAILLSTGRISSEMLFKAACMEVPVVASRTSPTSLSVALAQAWNLTLVGYVRRSTLNVYAGQQRVMHDNEEDTHAHL